MSHIWQISMQHGTAGIRAHGGTAARQRQSRSGGTAD